MRNIFIVSVFFLVAPVGSFAYSPIVSQPESPYAIIPIEGDITIEQNRLGDLNDFPDLYQFSSNEPFIFTTQLTQRNTNKPVPFGLLLVKVNDLNAGVTEIARQNVVPADWTENRSILLGMTFLDAPLITEELEAGTYRIEVSTPDNTTGNYMLSIGEESQSGGPWARFTSVFITQQHFGVFFMFALLSPYVSVPFLLLLTAVMWFKHRRQLVKV